MKHILLFEGFNIEQHLADRGLNIPPEELMLDKKTGDVYFFLYNLSGQIVGYQKYNPHYPKTGQRNSTDPRMVKYYNWVTDEDRGKMIAVWGLESYDINSKYLFITEGIFDAVRIHNAGYAGIAVLCNDPNDQLKYWLKTLPQIKIVIYDNDSAGNKLKKVGDYAFSTDIGKDLNDLSQEEAQVFLDNIIKEIEDEN